MKYNFWEALKEGLRCKGIKSENIKTIPAAFLQDRLLYSLFRINMKKFYKVNQYLAEKMGLSDNTKNENDLLELEARYESLSKLISNLYDKTEELLQPNTTTRQKIKLHDSIVSKSAQKSSKYPQVESSISNVLSKHSLTLGGEIGNIAFVMSENMKAIGDCKENLEAKMKDEVLDKIVEMRKLELTNVSKYLKKFESRRLEYDALKSRKVKEDRLNLSYQKYLEAKTTAYAYLIDCIENNEKLHSEMFLKYSLLLQEYYGSCLKISTDMTEKLQKSVSKLSSKTRVEPPNFSKALSFSFDEEVSSFGSDEKRNSIDGTVLSPKLSTDTIEPGSYATALYDFIGEEEDEICVKKGDQLLIVSRIDENWFMVSINGKNGMIPVTFVKREQ